MALDNVAVHAPCTINRFWSNPKEADSTAAVQNCQERCATRSERRQLPPVDRPAPDQFHKAKCTFPHPRLDNGVQRIPGVAAPPPTFSGGSATRRDSSGFGNCTDHAKGYPAWLCRRVPNLRLAG